MKLIDKAKQAAMESAVTKALEYLEKDPETNIPKLMELVDKFTPQDWYKGQRDAIRISWIQVFEKYFSRTLL